METTLQAAGRTLAFRPVELADHAILKPYLFRYGENSCQHSFATLFCIREKYGDECCIKNGTLYLHRRGLDREGYRSYLAPFGAEDLDAALGRIFEDAHARGCRVRFESVTASFAEQLRKRPHLGLAVEPARDLAEYLYTTDKLTRLPGRALVKKRADLRHFLEEYGDRLEVRPFGRGLVPELERFQEKWYAERTMDDGLEHEQGVIRLAFAYGEEIGITGIVVYLNGALVGYTLGYQSSDNCYDALIEKGDRSIRHLYRFLNWQTVQSCCAGLTYVNREEDLGIAGLRSAKLAYKPDILLEKFIATEVSDHHE